CPPFPQIDQTAGELQEEMHGCLKDANTDQSANGNIIKMNTDQPNPEGRLCQNESDSSCLQAPERSQPSVIEVNVEVNAQEQKGFTGNGIQDHLHKMTKRQLVPAKRQQFSPPSSKSVLASCPSETSIISAAALEELCDLRNYYSKQLRRINYTSHEQLQESGSGMLTCIREPLRGLRLPSSTTIAKSARNLWTRVSMRRKLIQR
ncbi:uncharacterized protein Hap1MRO34_014174, partial [Clarias gariepinus]